MLRLLVCAGCIRTGFGLLAWKSGQHLSAAHHAWSHSPAGLLERRWLDYHNASQVDWVWVHLAGLQLSSTFGLFYGRWMDHSHAGKMGRLGVVESAVRLPSAP
jgi:hypothetical protein